MEHSRRASDADRRASARTSRRLSLRPEGLDGGDDDYDLYALGGMVADGFRPQMEDTNENEHSHAPDAAAPRPSSPSVPQPTTSDPTSPPRPKRSSISKGPGGRDSLTLRHDGAVGYAAGASLSRVSSASTDTPYLTHDTPYEGPSGPSHPYQMYSQDTRMARTLSVTTTSTAPAARPESEYNGPRGPSHPYSMYPQNPVEESHPAVPAIPVGFTNAPDPYRRRIGPEGEDVADIIGPDGHTEELPPYTRYPDEFYARKIRDNDNAASSQSESPASGSAVAAAPVTAVLAIPGAGGTGLAARNPEFDPADDNQTPTPHSSHSSRSFMTESHHEINTAAAEVSEKKPLNKYQKFAKRKACGVVPYWAICLTVIAITVVAIIIAAVLATIFSRHKKPHGSNSSSSQVGVPTVTVTFDATPISTPTDLPALPTGTYGLPLELNQSPNTCFNDTTQSQAWSCDIVFAYAVDMQLVVQYAGAQPGKQGNYEVVIFSNTSTGDVTDSLTYGTQPPVMQPAMSMELVSDIFDADRGPAWFKMTSYNKTVVVPEDLFTASSGSSKVRRNGGGFVPSPDDFKRKATAQPGEKPWVCSWPDTFVEVFIYAQQNSSFVSQTHTASVATITSAPSTASTGAATGTATSTSSSASASSTEDVIDSMPIAAYPRAVKVKERRINKSPTAFCVQVEVQLDNSTKAVIDDDGNPVVVYIEENEPGPAMVDVEAKGVEDYGHEVSERRSLREEWFYTRDSDGSDDMSDCGCMWFSS